MGPRPQPRPTAGRSPPPPSPPHPRKFVRVIRAAQTQNPNPIPTTSRPLLSSSMRPGRGQQIRKRPSPSPPRDFSEPPITTKAPAITSRSQFGRLRESPNNQPPLPLTQNTGVSRVIKRPRPAPAPVEALPTPPPAVAAQSKVQQVLPDLPAEPPLERSKVIESTSDLPDKLDRASMEEGEVSAVADAEVSEFERAIADWEEMMAKSTAWIGEALGSVVADFHRLAAVDSGGDDRARTKLGELVRVSVPEMLVPAERHVEVIGNVGKKLEMLIERFGDYNRDVFTNLPISQSSHSSSLVLPSVDLYLPSPFPTAVGEQKWNILASW